MRWSVLGVVVAHIALITACSTVDQIECVDDGECTNGQCVGGQCVPLDDTGLGDVGISDAGETDTGETDAGETDTGETDTGETDTGEADSGDTEIEDTDVGEDAAPDVEEDIEEDAGLNCGNGTLDDGELCDASDPDDPNADVCREDCTFCGDGEVQGDAGETCDPAGAEDGATFCRPTCTFCGDGIEEPEAGESCDGGESNSDATPGACRTDCSDPFCGDGVTDPDEECDPEDPGFAYVDGTECSIFSCTVEAQGRCQPCSNDASCIGGLECALFSGGGTTTRCYASCDTVADCPPEHDCTPQLGGDRDICVPTGSCDAYPFEACDDLTDNDFDGLVDCSDPDCVASSACEATAEECDNGRDDDLDGVADCSDPDCGGDPACIITFEDCYNREDDDGNGLTDCDDPACDGVVGCSATETCDNEIDDDGDMLWDCADEDCIGFDRCEEPERSCNDGFDNDGDFRYDCDDPDCEMFAICLEFEVCDNELDDDFDGLEDCDDPDCETDSACDFEFDCFDRVDNDFDDKVDCQDDECWVFDICEPEGEVSCDDGFDNDSNGFMDCFDEFCVEIGECEGALTCPLAYLGSSLGRDVAVVAITSELPDEFTPECLAESGFDEGPEASFEWRAPFSGTYLFTTIGSVGSAAITLHNSCTSPAFACQVASPSGDTGEFYGTVAISRALEVGQEVTGLVHANPDIDSGLLKISIIPTSAPAEVLCNDGFDNDGDRIVDCEDPDCLGSPGCPCDSIPILDPPDCDPGGYCVSAGVFDGGICDCTSARDLCGNRCVNLETDMQNCGECWNTCPRGTRCFDGECGG